MDALIVASTLLFWVFFTLALRYYSQYLKQKKGLLDHLSRVVEPELNLASMQRKKRTAKWFDRITKYADDYAELGQRINFFSENRDIEELLRKAGRPLNLSVERFQGLKIFLTITGFFAGLLLLVIGFPLSQYSIIFLPLIGFLAPIFLLKRKAKQRQDELRLDLPDFLDTVSTSLQAGVSLDHTLREVIRYFDGPLHEEFSRFNQEIDLGVPREMAYRGLLERNDNPEFQSLIKSLIQGLRLGVPIATTFKVQADDMRSLRQEKVKELAAKASPKVTLVTTFIVVPVSLLMIAGLMVLNLIYGENSVFSLFKQ